MFCGHGSSCCPCFRAAGTRPGSSRFALDRRREQSQCRSGQERQQQAWVHGGDTIHTHTHTHIYICICIYIYVCIHTSKLFVLYYGIMFYFVMLYLPNVNPAVVHLQHATVNFGAGSQHDRSVRPLRSRIPRQLFSETLCSSCARKFDSEGMPCGVKTCQPLSTAAALVRRMTPVAQVKSRKDRHRHIS